MPGVPQEAYCYFYALFAVCSLLKAILVQTPTSLAPATAAHASDLATAPSRSFAAQTARPQTSTQGNVDKPETSADCQGQQVT